MVDLQGRNLQVCFKGEVNAPHTAWGFLSSVLDKEHALPLPCQCQMNFLNKGIGSPIVSILRSFFHQLYLTVLLLVSQELMNYVCWLTVLYQQIHILMAKYYLG